MWSSESEGEMVRSRERSAQRRGWFGLRGGTASRHGVCAPCARNPMSKKKLRPRHQTFVRSGYPDEIRKNSQGSFGACPMAADHAFGSPGLRSEKLSNPGLRPLSLQTPGRRTILARQYPKGASPSAARHRTSSGQVCPRRTRDPQTRERKASMRTTPVP